MTLKKSVKNLFPNLDSTKDVLVETGLTTVTPTKCTLTDPLLQVTEYGERYVLLATISPAQLHVAHVTTVEEVETVEVATSTLRDSEGVVVAGADGITAGWACGSDDRVLPWE